jgi:heme/copper-type cytochrome/quinol oxidase subunit 1
MIYFDHIGTYGYWAITHHKWSIYLVEVGSHIGWTVYPSLSGITSHFGEAVDSAISSLHIYGVSAFLIVLKFQACACSIMFSFLLDYSPMVWIFFLLSSLMTKNLSLEVNKWEIQNLNINHAYKLQYSYQLSYTHR